MTKHRSYSIWHKCPKSKNSKVTWIYSGCFKMDILALRQQLAICLFIIYNDTLVHGLNATMTTTKMHIPSI
uniref:Uncharacterized protein n=1 Tax=Anguilla anguilla TaxID=7936 RepID=A0A0E9X202_ANGAN